MFGGQRYCAFGAPMAPPMAVFAPPPMHVVIEEQSFTGESHRAVIDLGRPDHVVVTHLNGRPMQLSPWQPPCVLPHDKYADAFKTPAKTVKVEIHSPIMPHPMSMEHREWRDWYGNEWVQMPRCPPRLRTDVRGLMHDSLDTFLNNTEDCPGLSDSE